MDEEEFSPYGLAIGACTPAPGTPEEAAPASAPGDITAAFQDPTHFDLEADPVLTVAEQIARMTYVAAHVPGHGRGLVEATEALARVLKAEADLRVARLEKDLQDLKHAKREGLNLLKKD